MTPAGTLDSVPPKPPQASALPTRFRGLVREVGKFGAVGGFAFTVDVVIYNVLLMAGAETLTAKAASTIVATTIAFLGNRFWTWRHGEHTNMARQYTTFFVLNLIGLGIALTCLAISHYGLGQIWPVLQSKWADNLAGLGLGTALGTMFRFWSYRRFVFRVTAAPAPSTPGSASIPGSAANPGSASTASTPDSDDPDSDNPDSDNPHSDDPHSDDPVRSGPDRTGSMTTPSSASQ